MIFSVGNVAEVIALGWVRTVVRALALASRCALPVGDRVLAWFVEPALRVCYGVRSKS